MKKFKLTPEMIEIGKVLRKDCDLPEFIENLVLFKTRINKALSRPKTLADPKCPIECAFKLAQDNMVNFRKLMEEIDKVIVFYHKAPIC